MTGALTACQSCGSSDLELVLSLGFTPLVNDFRPIAGSPRPFTSNPTELLRCAQCELVQLGFIPSQEEVFPASYPYRSSVTKILRDNFRDLYGEVTRLLPLKPEDLVVDIGGNDGNLLSNFTAHRTLNVTPEDIGKLGEERGVPHLQRYWGADAAAEVLAKHGKARVITATNVFAHVPDPHGFVEAALSILVDDGLFVTESHYLGSLLETVQYDTVYAEHQRYYSVASIYALLRRHGLKVNKVTRIDTHGGSIRVVASRRGEWDQSNILLQDMSLTSGLKMNEFSRRVAESKSQLWDLLSTTRRIDPSAKIAGVGAPSRASTLISYTGIDHNALKYICEVPGSHKLGKFMPGTRIPVVDEAHLFADDIDYALLFSWHVADELMASLRSKGFRGRFIIPLPTPRVVE